MARFGSFGLVLQQRGQRQPSHARKACLDHAATTDQRDAFALPCIEVDEGVRLGRLMCVLVVHLQKLSRSVAIRPNGCVSDAIRIIVVPSSDTETQQQVIVGDELSELSTRSMSEELFTSLMFSEVAIFEPRRGGRI